MVHPVRTMTMTLLALIVACSTVYSAQKARFFKAECLTSASYIKLEADGQYTVIWREHMGIFQRDRGTWKQNEAIISFTPTDPKTSPYEGTETAYRGKTFLAWASDDAAGGIAIPIASTKNELDANPNELPLYVFFKTTAKVYDAETKQTYPFHYGTFQRSPN